MEDESYVKIVNNLLLHKIFDHLPLNDQLNVRKVNTDWEAEAKHALFQNPWLEINLNDQICLNEFLLDYDSPHEPNGLLPLAKVSIKPSRIIDRRLDKFGQEHAEYIRNLTIQLEEGIHIFHFESKSRYLLKYFTNLEKLRIDINIERCRFESSDSESLPLAPPLPNLRHFEMACPVSHVELPYSIIVNAPNLKSVSLDMRDAATVHPLTGLFLTKLKDLRMTSLDLTLSLSDPGNPDSLIGKLMQSELKPQQLIIYLDNLEPQQNHVVIYPETTQNGDELTEIRQNLLNNLIAKLCRTGLKKLLIQSYCQKDLQISLPAETTCIKLLNFGVQKRENLYNMHIPQKNLFKKCFSKHMSIVRPNSPLTSAQLPYLETLMTVMERDVSLPLDQENVFKNLNELVVLATWFVLGQRPSSVTWPLQFPNLTILDTRVQAGHEEFLDPIFMQMVNLVELRLNYNSVWQKSPDPIWDKITGGLRPILSKNSPLDKIIPLRQAEEDISCAAQDSAMQLGTVPALQNLRKLKILKLEFMPTCVAVAIIHLTALQKIPSYSILRLLYLMDHNELHPGGNFIPAQEWINVLENYHGHVKTFWM